MRRLVIAMIVLGPTLAGADTIEEKRQKEQAEKSAASSIKQLNAQCKTEIPDAGYIDWSSWKALKSDDGKGSTVMTACKWVLTGVTGLCRSDKIAQETVAKTIKKLSCMGDSTEGFTFEVKDGTLVIHTQLGATDGEKKVKVWLTKNL